MAKVNLKLEPWQAQLVLTELARRLGEEERTTTWRRFYTDRLLLTMTEIADQLLPTQVVIEGPLRAELYRLLLALRRPFIGIYGTLTSLAERLVKLVCAGAWGLDPALQPLYFLVALSNGSSTLYRICHALSELPCGSGEKECHLAS